LISKDSHHIEKRIFVGLGHARKEKTCTMHKTEDNYQMNEEQEEEKLIYLSLREQLSDP
jgi:hypothetical protein